VLASDPFVDVGSWESEYPGRWPDFPVVCKALQEELLQQPAFAGGADSSAAQQTSSGPDILSASRNPACPKVFYVCGADHAQKCNLSFGMRGGVGVVVVPRKSSGGSVVQRMKENANKSVFVAQPASGEIAGFSSTEVRLAIKNKNEASLAQALSPEAVEYLLRPSAVDLLRFADDFFFLIEDGRLREAEEMLRDSLVTSRLTIQFQRPNFERRLAHSLISFFFEMRVNIDSTLISRLRGCAAGASLWFFLIYF